MEPAQPIVGRVRSLLDQLLGIVQTRVEMLSAELQSEKLAAMVAEYLGAKLSISTTRIGF